MGQECTISAYQHVRIGEQCVIADRAMFIDFDHGVVEVERPIRVQGIYKRDVEVGSNVWIGYGACILRGVRVGDNSIVGTNSVVTKDVPANAVVAGIPARVIRMREAPQELSWDNPVEPDPDGPYDDATNRGMTQHGENAIEARDLEKSYPGGVRALDGLGFAVAAGTVFGLLGPNGAGKSTPSRSSPPSPARTAARAPVAGIDVRRRSRSRSAGSSACVGPEDRGRSGGHRPREPDSPGPGLRDARPRAARPGRRAARPLRPRPRPPIVSPAPTPAACSASWTSPTGAGSPPAGALPRRADHRARPGGPGRPVGGDRPPHRRGRPDDPAHHPLPGGGRPAGQPPGDRRSGPGGRRGHARRAEGRAAGRRHPRRAPRPRAQRRASTGPSRARRGAGA